MAYSLEKYKIFYGFFVLLSFSLFCLYETIKINVDTHHAKQWIESSCIIEEFNVYTSGSRGRVQKIHVKYGYHFDEKQYKGSRFNLGSQQADRYNIKELRSKYRIGTQSSCFINPNNPEESAIIRDIDYNLLNGELFMYFIVFILCSIGAIALYTRNIHGKQINR